MTGVDSAPLVKRILRAQAGDSDECGRIVEENSALIWSIARRYFGRGTEPEDLFQLGCIGMVKAVRGFDPSYGTAFSTYAVPKIAGEIRRFLRDDGLVKVSRQMKTAAGIVSRTAARLRNELGREPLLSELSEASGMSPEEIALCENAGAATSLDRETGENGATLEDVIGIDAPEEEVLDRVLVADILSRLPEPEQQVIRLRFYRGLTQDASAKILGISQVQVSRVERRAIEHLRRELA